MNQKNDQTVAHQAADVVDNVADGIRSAAHTVRQTAGRAAGAVGDKYEEVGQFARDSIDHSPRSDSTPGKKASKVPSAKIPRPRCFWPSHWVRS